MRLLAVLLVIAVFFSVVTKFEKHLTSTL